MAINEVMLQTMTLTRGATDAKEVVANWHREEHGGRFEHCYEQPCHAIRHQVNASDRPL